MTHSPFPMRRITSGPKHHWSGYYYKLQFDPSCRHVLGMAVDFEHRSPAAGDAIGADFRRLHHMRPGGGYAGIAGKACAGFRLRVEKEGSGAGPRRGAPQPLCQTAPRQ